MRTQYFSKERLAKLVEVFPKATFDAEAEEPAFIVTAADFPAVLRALKEKEGFDRLGNLTAVDWKDHIEMVYHLYNMEENVKLEVKAALDSAAPVIESATSLYPGAEFEEREVYDLMGVEFLSHPDLRRILMPDNYPAHPLRKDFVAPVPKMEGGKLVWLKKAPTS
ncbi:NADH-quinone oxidoreductase subunit C [Selenomonas sputigena]|uniref:NADH-quinone oxidoreductase n=1 Tax=Selenomonas sputigena (strain ATCC 35185 / DSM 20758 / CCUG 44933 / VPI D19B-28) TaxID=546271 RepID=C9LVK2_SELS3|nr:NADH-quinone oxidoreductase subunit C [Selenomonas sputigena]AEB99128.1 NADH dehydrogenase (ubiquinone) 30 kDa subunit [Selenomonas sputigena ATCC 35185]EEX77165.1 respiratory-chain NADH dehydrogenase, 30 Kd subunit [Selenomonas sputigena ATCC 35185]